MRNNGDITWRTALVWGGAMTFLTGALTWLSTRFVYGVPVAEKPIEWLVILLAALGLLFMLMAGRIVSRRIRGGNLFLLIGVGLLVRGFMLISEPMMETDFYRYLWDGAVLAQGENPYRPVPRQIVASGGWLSDLAFESGLVLERINHPELRTIYTPIAQVFFSLSYLLAPWSLVGWRLILLMADAITLGLLLMILHRAALPREFALIYWLNPLVLKEISNAAHMDILLAPFILGALLLASRRRLTLAVVCLAAATGLKIWPVLLLPLVLRAGAHGWRQAAASACLYAALLVVMSIPVLAAGLDSSSGFTAYAGRWEMNNGPSLVPIWLGRWLAAMDWFPISARTFSSGVLALIVGSVALLAARRPVVGLLDLYGRALAVSALVFLISPTQFPWYSLWFLPLLAIRPHPALLLYAVTLPLYYLRFRYDDLGYANLFDNGVVWLEHGPVLILFLAAKWKPEWLASLPGSLLSVRSMDEKPGACEVTL
ncbi:MAG: hypothetical protein Kow0059_20480 [Candidatus Sumerlaeia bacterium]